MDKQLGTTTTMYNGMTMKMWGGKENCTQGGFWKALEVIRWAGVENREYSVDLR